MRSHRVWRPSKKAPRRERPQMNERISHAQGCEKTMTFDAGAVKAAGMSLVT